MPMIKWSKIKRGITQWILPTDIGISMIQGSKIKWFMCWMIWRNIKLVLSLHVIQWHSRGCLKLTFLKTTTTFRFNITTACLGLGIHIISTRQSWEPIFIIGISMLIGVRFYNKNDPSLSCMANITAADDLLRTHGIKISRSIILTQSFWSPEMDRFT